MAAAPLVVVSLAFDQPFGKHVLSRVGVGTFTDSSEDVSTSERNDSN